jgi:CHAD domain-containing protein
MATKREVERKYEVPPDFALPDLGEVPGVATVDEPAEHHLTATYYDTADLRLAAEQVSLRRRTGGADAGWHLKRPTSDGERTETDAPLGSRSSVPRAIQTQVRALSRGEPLRPVARVRTQRLERPVRAADGSLLALVVDDSVTSEALGERMVVQQWREVEVELVDGSRRLLRDLDASLRSYGARPAHLRSKYARALADRYPTGQQDLDGQRGAVGEYLRAQRQTLLAADPAVRADDPDAVHDMRVATRRLRSTLRTFRPLLDRARTEPLREELRWLAGVLGGVRDGHVMSRRLAAAIDSELPELVVGPVAARLQQRLAARTAEARTQLLAALDSPRYLTLLDALDEVIDAAAHIDASPARLRRRARKALRRADRRMAAAAAATGSRPGAAATRDERLHEARKAYKRARYAAEAVVPLAGRSARRLAKRLSTVQDVLGSHQDARAAAELLRDYGMRAQLEAENAFTYGLLHARQQCAGGQALEGLPRALRRANRTKLRRWLGS